MREAAEKRLGQVVRRARSAAVVSGGDDARVRRERPAVVHEALQHDLEDDRLGLLGGLGQLVEEQDVQLAVLAEPFELHEPDGLIDRAAVVVHRGGVATLAELKHTDLIPPLGIVRRQLLADRFQFHDITSYILSERAKKVKPGISPA